MTPPPSPSPSSAARAERRAPALRLFIALWPDDGLREALAAAQGGWRWPPGARPVPAEKLHLTLHFLGAQPADRLPRLRQAIDAEQGFGCDLVLDHAACWRNGVAVLEPRTPPPVLAALHRALGASLAAMAITPEDRPWKPHVTLARDAGGATVPAALSPLRWRTGAPVLVESLSGRGGYRVL